MNQYYSLHDSTKSQILSESYYILQLHILIEHGSLLLGNNPAPKLKIIYCIVVGFNFSKI